MFGEHQREVSRPESRMRASLAAELEKSSTGTLEDILEAEREDV
jgi:hypothetical protein